MKKEEINMRLSAEQIKRALSAVLCLVLLLSSVAFALTVSAEEADELAGTGADIIADDDSISRNDSDEDLAVTGAAGDYVYCVNNAGWSTVSVYMWNSSSDTNGSWPGTAMTNIGSNIWRYQLPKAYANIIFSNGGQSQTADLTYPGGDRIFDNKTNTWSTYDDPTKPTGSTTATTATTAPTQAATSASGAQYVYCENEAGWSVVTAYMWNSDTDTNSGWPGVAMTNIGNNIWRYQLPKSYKNIIFSQSGQNQTSDLSFPGAGYIYNNSTGKWEIYDTSPLQVSFFGSDLNSPQYDGVGIVLSATAEGQGTVYYKFSVTSGSNTTVLKDFSTVNYVQWIPKSAGTYTLTYDFKDAKGNTNKRTKSFTIESGLSSVSPYIKTVTPNGGEIKRNSAVNVSVTAGGGLTGTNLLFYKYVVRNSSGDIVNVPYYTLNGSYSFTPTALGAYTVTVFVQGSDNTTVERTYSYTSVSSISPTESPYVPTDAPTQKPTTAPTQAPTQKPTTAPTQPPTQAPTQKPTTAPAVIRGDADDDGDITIVDATCIQRYELGLPLGFPINERNADVDGDGDITIVDATLVQRHLIGMIDLLS